MDPLKLPERKTERRAIAGIPGTQAPDSPPAYEVPVAGSPASAALEPVLQTRNLSVTYPGRGTGQPERPAVNALTLVVRRGEVFGFLGPNGAGKTTTMNVLLGFINASSGSASLFGTDVREPIARQRIGYLPELTYYYKFLSAEELLRFYARIFRIPRAERDKRIDAVLKLVDLDQARKRQIKTYSKGMQQRVGLAQALINDPELLILDEPTSGLDPIGRMRVREVIQRLKKRGQNRLLLLARAGRSGNGLRPRRHPAPGRTQGRRPGLRACPAAPMQPRAAFP